MNKEKTIKIASFVFLLAIAGIFFYFQWSKRSQNLNPFAEFQQSSTQTSASSQSLITLNGIEYNFNSLPKHVQVEIFKENQAHYDKINAILKDFSVRLHASRLTNPNVSPDDLPLLYTYISNQITPAQINEIYNNNKALFPKDHDPMRAKTEISFELFSQKSYEFLLNNLTSLYETKSLIFNNPPPTIPADWLNLEGFPKLGSSSATNRLVVVANYTCSACTKLNQELAAAYSKFGADRLEITYVPYGRLNSIDDVFNRAAICVHQQDQDLFWKFHIDLIKNIDNLRKVAQSSNIDQARELVDNLMKKVDVNRKTFEKCMSDKNSEAANQYAELEKKLSFLDLQNLPIFILNNKKLDLEGRSLSKVLEQWSIQ